MRPFAGIAFKLISVMMFITMYSLIKATAGHVPPGESVFFRSFCAIPIILIWLVFRGDLRTGLKVGAPMGHFWRGFVGTAAMGMGFAGLGLLPLPEVTAIGFATPLLVVVFAAMFLNEQVGVLRFGAVVLGLIGVLIVLAPRLDAPRASDVEAMQAVGALVVLMGAICAALAQIYVRKLVQTEETSAIVFYFSITSSLLALLTIPFGWVLPSAFEFSLLVLAGIAGGIGQIFLTSAYRFADASVVAPFDYAAIIFALLIGYLIFNEVPTATMLSGAALVIAAGFIIILRERHLGIQRNRARAARTPE